MSSGDVGDPSGEEVARALQDALYDILHSKPPEPVCECGALTAIQHGSGVGFKCGRGHRLPGQDLPPHPAGDVPLNWEEGIPPKDWERDD